MEVWSISWLDCSLLQKKPAYGPAVVMVMHETISSTDGLKATCESFGMQSYCFMMHLNSLSLKTRLKLRKLIVFIRFFSFRARKQILVRGCKRNFGEVKDPKSPSQPMKKKKIGNEGKRLIEKSEKRCRTHWGHENNPRCSKLFDPGGSHQTNFQVGEVGVIHLVFALQILRL